MTRLLASLVLVAAPLLLGGCFQTQTLGTVAGARVTITPLQSPEQLLQTFTSSDATMVIAEKGQSLWSQADSREKLSAMGWLRPELDTLDPGSYHLLTASGGVNRDPGMAGDYQLPGRPIHGCWHAIVPPGQLADVRSKISLLTEAAFQWVQINAGQGNRESTALDPLLAAVAQRLVQDIDGDGVTTYQDLLLWDAYAHQDLYLGDTAALQQLDLAITLGFPQAEIQRIVVAMLTEPSDPAEPDLLDYLKARFLGLSE